MEILLDNPLAAMYGPYFLIFYGFVIGFSLFLLAFCKKQADHTDRLPSPPIPSRIDPYEVAYLRGGSNEMIRAVVFSLIRKDYLEFTGEAPAIRIKKTLDEPGRPALSEIERAALDWFAKSHLSYTVFKDDELAYRLYRFSDMYQAALENRQLLTDEESRRSFVPLERTVYLIIGGLGFYKAAAAVLNGHFNILFLIVFGVAGCLIARRIARLPRLTKLGKSALENMQMAFENLKYKSQPASLSGGQAPGAERPTFAGVDPLLLTVGVFGGGVLAGAAFDEYNLAFHKAQQQQQQQQQANGGSGCGSSCGSYSSGGSGDGGGSSCSSGGSSCGGGCGGGCGGCS